MAQVPPAFRHVISSAPVPASQEASMERKTAADFPQDLLKLFQ